MKNYNLEDEEKMHPYEFYGKVFEEKHGEGTFLMRSALKYVIDDYDEYISSVEVSHFEDLGYYEVINFDLPIDVSTLDLTWMRTDDVFRLEDNNQLQFIKEIQVRIDNLGYSRIPVESISDYGLLLTVNGAESKSSVVQQIKDFKWFIMKHRACLNGIKLEGFSPVVEYLLTMYAKKCGVSIGEKVYENGRHKNNN